jgi:hypothetical protein
LTDFVIRNYTPIYILIAITIYLEVWKLLAPLALDIQADAISNGSKMNRGCMTRNIYSLISTVILPGGFFTEFIYLSSLDSRAVRAGVAVTEFVTNVKGDGDGKQKYAT